MNGKKAKALRKQAQALTVGNPTRMLVQYMQELNAEKQKASKSRFSVGAVNAPGTTRGVYRSLKSGRSIDPKRIVMQQDPPKRTEVAKATASVQRTPGKPTTRKSLLAALAGIAASVKAKVLSI